MNLKPEDWNHMDQVLQICQLLKDLFQLRMDNKRLKVVQSWGELGAGFQKICLKETPFIDLMVITKGLNSNRQLKLLEESGFTPFKHQHISGQESPFFNISGSFQKKTRIKGKKQDFFQQEAERFRPNVTEAVVLGEKSTQEPEIAVNTADRISNPTT
ncbi:hypothetical protein O181_072920 [Austropuccinia psidii MF-1]|uniref:Uncharacterized protein n=1 Tax=Austropuccinia psidii MF-1 TaxID=1389203 RepID=A0A9Q3F1G5_9BASI|nr:hypothetical protein [Austropuccinia psidii MF-1]